MKAVVLKMVEYLVLDMTAIPVHDHGDVLANFAQLLGLLDKVLGP